MEQFISQRIAENNRVVSWQLMKANNSCDIKEVQNNSREKSEKRDKERSIKITVMPRLTAPG